MRTDTERLNWIETHQADIQYRCHEAYDPWAIVYNGPGVEVKRKVGSSLRKAIDSAMNEESVQREEVAR